MQSLRDKISNVTKDRAKDTGMALVLICLLAAYFSQSQRFIASSIIFLVINMIVPSIFKPLALVWFGLSELLGTVASKIVLSLIFFVIVTPVGLIRRALGYDTLRVRQWKKGSSSVFKERNMVFSPKDIERPY